MKATEYVVTKASQHLTKCLEWPASTSALHYCPRMGFESFRLREQALTTNCSYGLLNALLSFYLVDGQFQLNDEVTIVYGLQDLFFATGLPISGLPVIASPPTNEKDLFSFMFGGAFPEDTRDDMLKDGLTTKDNRENSKKKGVNVAWLENFFKNVGCEVNHPLCKEHVRAYILYMIYHYIIPENESGVISANYLTLVEDITKIQDYAWGAASLAKTYDELARIKSAPKTSRFHGLVYPLEISFLGRIPNLLRALPNWPTKFDVDQTTVVLEIADTFPLMSNWMQLIGKKLNAKGLYVEFVKILQNVKPDNVTWKPYELVTVPREYGQNHKCMESCRIPIICFHIMNYHRPDLAPRQFSAEALADLCPLMNLKVLKHKQVAAGKNVLDTSLDTSYVEVMKMWENVMSNCLPENSPTVNQPSHSPTVDMVASLFRKE